MKAVSVEGPASVENPVVDLSIDFDFFCREDPKWDFGHRESPLFERTLWPLRYAMYDLIGECDPATHADCLPEQLPAVLAADHGIVFDRICGVARSLTVAASHVHAYHHFTRLWHRDGAPSALVQLDAHHDLFSPCDPGADTPSCDCGNWLTALRALHGEVPVVQLYPKWLSEAQIQAQINKACDVEGAVEVEYMRLKRYRREPPARVRSVYLCLSPAWVPPHLDDAFYRLVRALSLALDVPSRYVEFIVGRKNCVPAAKEGIVASYGTRP